MTEPSWVADGGWRTLADMPCEPGASFEVAHRDAVPPWQPVRAFIDADQNYRASRLFLLPGGPCGMMTMIPTHWRPLQSDAAA